MTTTREPKSSAPRISAAIPLLGPAGEIGEDASGPTAPTGDPASRDA
jgi:hypothetical protein